MPLAGRKTHNSRRLVKSLSKAARGYGLVLATGGDAGSDLRTRSTHEEV